MKLGYIDYLNCYPFYYHMFEKSPLPFVRLHPGYPSLLNRMTTSGELDMSPISAATCAEISRDIHVLPNVCLSSVGYVKSVILVSKHPIEALTGKTIGITTASHTSVVLLKILLQRYYDLDPIYTPTPPLPSLADLDAALLIGNEAMIYEPGPGEHVYDLGEMWMTKTGYPVVFAVFVVRKEAVNRWANEIREVIVSYDRSLECLASEKERLIEYAARKYPDIPYSIEAYFNLLQFRFTPTLKEALHFYHDQAIRMNLITPMDGLTFLDMDKLC